MQLGVAVRVVRSKSDLESVIATSLIVGAVIARGTCFNVSSTRFQPSDGLFS